MKFINKFFGNSYLQYLKVLLLDIIIFSIYFLLNKDNTLKYNLYNGFSYIALIDFFLGLLSLVTRLGAFNTFQYGFKYLFKKTDENSATLKDFENHIQTKRSKSPYHFAPYIMFSILFLIISLFFK